MKNKYFKLFSLWLPVIFWLAVIFGFSNHSTIQASYFDLYDFIIKKTAHLSEYAILFTLLFRALHQSWKEIEIKLVEKRAYLFLCLYAISDEIHQRFIPGRTSTLRDVLIDFTGGLIGFLLIRQIAKCKKCRLINHFFYGE